MSKLRIKKSLSYQKQQIDYFLEIKNQKYIRLKVDNEQIIVSAPVHVQDWEIEQLIYTNIKKITTMLEKNKSKKYLVINGDKLFFKLFDEYKEFKLTTISERNNYSFKIYENLEDTIKHIYKKAAIIYRHIFEERFDFWMQIMQTDCKNLSLRVMKTRWGVCYPDKAKIILNTRLLHYPQQCLDYVIVHELSHMLHKNHSKLFWYNVEKYFPDYKKAIKALK
ncbi:SprT family zinc-dependent metalloprotease [Spiroplasma endosymbiont of Crioceris asparagi]|uniref:M48 family metallopeptidase n=1 Tax=Spiroplasma endosymbiont of Crioceris asparagi TaxID=3066286 RepID=UPI0030CCF724